MYRVMRTERNATEDKLLKLRSDLGQCQRRFRDLVRKIQRFTQNP